MNKEKKWTAVFGRSPSQIEYKPENYAKDITLRYPVPMPFDCTAVRLHFKPLWDGAGYTVFRDRGKDRRKPGGYPR